MRKAPITLPELGLIAGTRAAAGAGLGLLLADHLSASQRKTLGWTLLLIGAASTVPLLIDVFGKLQTLGPQERAQPTPDLASR